MIKGYQAKGVLTNRNWRHKMKVKYVPLQEYKLPEPWIEKGELRKIPSGAVSVLFVYTNKKKMLRAVGKDTKYITMKEEED